MYLTLATRPDLAYAVNVASRAQEAPTEAHVKLVKRILRYWKVTINDGIQFKRTLYTTVVQFNFTVAIRSPERTTQNLQDYLLLDIQNAYLQKLL
ncbi:hypothetical protein QE152_g34023 [Popillia japonica]|uniref:Mitochondrial protein n=1 Tax=Popillia japonica TaxID=7064 RepID=A0AAW1IV55_POPJA